MKARDLRAAALNCAKHGLHVLPLWWIRDGQCACPDGANCGRNPGKHPLGALVPRGLTEATIDTATITKWWTRYPEANIGLALEPSGLIAFDVDTPRGYETLAAIEREHSEFAVTARQRSGSGNLHVLAKHPQFKIRGNHGGITMRGANYIVVAPSNHESGGVYEWERAPWECEPIVLPEALAEKLKRRTTTTAAKPRTAPTSNELMLKRARAWLAKAEPSIEGSGGEARLFAVCCKLVHGFELCDSDALSAILLEFNPRCVPPWGDDEIGEIERKITEARTKCDAPSNFRVEDRPPRSPSGTRAKTSRKRTGGQKGKSKDFDPNQVALKYVNEHEMHADGVLLRRWRGDFYRWATDRGHYAAVSEEGIRKALRRGAKLRLRANVGEIRDALIAVDDVLIDEAEIGTWLDDHHEDVDYDPIDLAPCRNGILHLPTRTLLPATPRYFSTTAIRAAYDPDAPPPTEWLAFLRQLWPDDEESIAALQEWMGYLLTPDTRQQKILLLVGPRRCGKGTIARVIIALLGKPSVAGPTLASLGTNFGLWPLIGRTAAMISDARLGARSDVAQIVERLLTISGEDALTIDRKHREPWTGQLPTRFTILSNELPRFSDSSDALPGRMVSLELTRSFFGCEDPSLTRKLVAELPGIFAWAVEGWARLRARGHFVQPASSRDMLDELIDLSSPVAAWARQECATDERDDEKWLACEYAFESFSRWCVRQGIRHVPPQVTFGRDLRAATNCKRVQVTRGGGRVGVYRGLSLRSTVRPPDDPVQPPDDISQRTMWSSDAMHGARRHEGLHGYAEDES